MSGHANVIIFYAIVYPCQAILICEKPMEHHYVVWNCTPCKFLWTMKFSVQFYFMAPSFYVLMLICIYYQPPKLQDKVFLKQGLVLVELRNSSILSDLFISVVRCIAIGSKSMFGVNFTCDRTMIQKFTRNWWSKILAALTILECL